MRAPEAPAVAVPVMIQHWRLITFLHWPYPSEVIRRLLPDGLQVDTFDGTAWIGLLPFHMRAVRPPGLPPLPWLSQFPETNLRTYVRGPDGDGIFFLSLEAARLPAVLAARMTLGLPYRWAPSSVDTHGQSLRYQARRQWPGPKGAGYRIQVRVAEAIPEDELAALDHFLTARYRLYTAHAGRLLSIQAQHRPWPLYHAHVEELHQNLLSSAGLPDPRTAPLVHASPGVRVRIGSPHLLRRQSRDGDRHATRSKARDDDRS